MKLFAKIFLYTTIILSMALSLSGYLLITFSYKNAMNREIERALDEYQYNKFSVQAALITNEDILPDSFALDSSSNTALFSDDYKLAFSSLPFDPPYDILPLITDNRVMHRIIQTGFKQYILVCGKLVQSDRIFYLSVASDISKIGIQKEEMVQSFGRIYFITLGVSVFLIFVLATLLTRPIKKLTKASVEIAGGNYDRRISFSSSDELGELSKSFNIMADAIEEKIGQLYANARQKEDFVANFAHELKTPLTSVIGYADMIYQKDLPQDVVKSAAKYILDEGLRLESLSLKLMELIVLNRQDFTLVELAADELLEDIVLTLKPMFIEKKVELRYEAEHSYIKVDYDLFKTLLFNLIDNSIKAGSKNIKIFGNQHGNQYRILIADNGCGIPAQEIERITEAFYMVDKSRSRKQHGAGLGLALASRIAEIHGSRLGITSEEHIGTTIELTLHCGEGIDDE